MNYKIITLFASTLLLPPVVSANELTSDFDLLCSIYREATELNLESTQLRSDYINTQVDSRISSNEVIETHYTLFNADPEDRYSILVEAANHYTSKDWSCSSAKELMVRVK